MGPGRGGGLWEGGRGFCNPLQPPPGGGGCGREGGGFATPSNPLRGGGGCGREGGGFATPSNPLPLLFNDSKEALRGPIGLRRSPKPKAHPPWGAEFLFLEVPEIFGCSREIQHEKNKREITSKQQLPH